MPGLDRIVTVSIQTPGMRNEVGRYVPGQTVENRVWATRKDKSLADIDESGGSRSIAEREYQVRWRADLAETIPENITVTDAGQQFNIVNIRETSDERRRRFMTLEVTAEIGQ